MSLLLGGRDNSTSVGGEGLNVFYRLLHVIGAGEPYCHDHRQSINDADDD